MGRCGRGNCRGRRRRRRSLRWLVVGVIEDASASLAVEEFLVLGALQFLDHVRTDVDAALAATLAADFGQGDTTMPLRDALIVVDQIFGHCRDSLGPYSFGRGEFLLRGVVFGLNCMALHVGGRFTLLHG